MRTWNAVALALLIVGGLNWLLVGLFQWDLVASLFGGPQSAASRVVYTIVGLCAIYCLALFNRLTNTVEDRSRAGNR